MIKKIGKHIKNKTILILGFGKEGQSTYHLIRKLFPEKQISIADIDFNNIAALRLKSNDANATVILGEDYLSILNNFDLILKSPGIYLPDTENNISSQTDLFLQFYSEQTIGVTGTKGKSTTSSLIHHILQQSGNDALLVGNIGNPPFDIIEQITNETIIVFELSSHQLMHITQSPSVALFLNLFPEHLDHYPDFETYEKAKSTIFKYLKPTGIQIFDIDQKNLRFFLNTSVPKNQSLGYSAKKTAACFLEDEQIFIREDKNFIPVIHKNEIKNLIGQHNLQNIMAATLACTQKGIQSKIIRKAIISFKSLEHRLEYVGCFAGIHFYNDSIATIPEACIMAIKALPKTSTLLLGGFDRGLDYSNLYRFLKSSSIRNFIFMGPAGKRMKNEFQTVMTKNKNCLFVDSLEAAFVHIPKITHLGKVCLLSPAAASYDQYKNFEERGLEYKKIAGNL